MHRGKLTKDWLCLATAAWLFGTGVKSCAADTTLEGQVRLLQEQNALLQAQIQQQGQTLDTLKQKIQDLEAANTERENSTTESTPPPQSGFSIGKAAVSGEGGVGFYKTGAKGFAPDSEFSVREARLFLDAPIWKDIYFYGELDLATPENSSPNISLGELYADFEDASQLWGQDGQLNLRAGNMNIPFGEEYFTRFAIDNPLILNSVSDLWGFDPGVEAYGSLGKWSYVVAAQNSANDLQDESDDKSVAGRISFDPNAWWHFSVSGMRTGKIETQNGGLSAIWFGNGFFQSIGSASTTTFQANAVELDMTARWESGYLKAFGGYARYGDNDPTANNDRDIFYYSAEVEQDLPRRFYAVTRFSEALTANGYPIQGNAGYGEYGSGLTTDLWRLSLGLGYRFSDRLIVKTEYAFEGGKLEDGGSRNDENFFGTEIAFKF